jgi:hypothetical protein
VSEVKRTKTPVANKSEQNEEPSEEEKEEEVQCPRMLKDLLVTPEILNVLGNDFIFLLRMLIGPPTGKLSRAIL